MSAETYIYADETCLRPELWSFNEFAKNNAWKWYGGTRWASCRCWTGVYNRSEIELVRYRTLYHDYHNLQDSNVDILVVACICTELLAVTRRLHNLHLLWLTGAASRAKLQNFKLQGRRSFREIGAAYFQCWSDMIGVKMNVAYCLQTAFRHFMADPSKGWPYFYFYLRAYHVPINSKKYL